MELEASAQHATPTGVSPGRKRRSGCELRSAESPSRGGWGKSSTREAWAAVTWNPTATMTRRRVRKPSAWQPSRANTREEEAWEVRANRYIYSSHSFCLVSQVRQFSWSYWGLMNIFLFFPPPLPSRRRGASEDLLVRQWWRLRRRQGPEANEGQEARQWWGRCSNPLDRQGAVWCRTLWR